MIHTLAMISLTKDLNTLKRVEYCCQINDEYMDKFIVLEDFDRGLKWIRLVTSILNEFFIDLLLL